MKIQKIFISALLAVSPLLGYAQSDYIPGGYKLVWQDNFDGDQLDENNWNIEVNGDGGGNQELQYYRRENVAVADGGVPSSRRRRRVAQSRRLRGRNACRQNGGFAAEKQKNPRKQSGIQAVFA